MKDNTVLHLAQQAMQDACAILRSNLAQFGSAFLFSCTENQRYPLSENVEWTTGFCTGTYWLAWEFTHEKTFKTAALEQVDSFLARIENKIDVNHHDMGFLYTPSCVAAYQLTGNETAKTAALLAAQHLASRFQEKGSFLQAWGDLGQPENYRLIIDCLLNLPLLYWASRVTGDEHYAALARRHTQTSLKHLVREDCSTYHTYYFDPATGKPLRGVTHQGYRDGSAWARGQAWGVYGTALAYRETKLPQCQELFEQITDYFLAHLPQDRVPYWDLSFFEGSTQPKDSSAAAVAVCGILEMLPHLPPQKAKKYQIAAEKMLSSLIQNYAVRTPAQSNGLLLHGVYAKSSPFNPIPQDRGVDECNLWGDYFYLEALIRYQKSWTPYWCAD